jgi:hypothetical protein
MPEIAVPPVDVGDTYSLFTPDLLLRTSREFMESLQAESRGEWRNAAVRSYFQSIAPHVSRQHWVLARNGATVYEVDITGEPPAEDLPGESPYLEYVDGTVVGVGFRPGPLEVRLRSDGSTTTLPAREEHVEKALAMRGQQVRALALRGEPNRLLWLRRSGEARVHERRGRIDALAERWGEVLRRLAK